MGRVFSVLAIMALTALPAAVHAQGQGAQDKPPLGFFITSTPMNGANLGGLEGADKHCQQLEVAVRAG